MFCSRCGTEFQDSAKFCPSCGLDLAATTPLAAVVQSAERTEVDQVRAALKDEYEIKEELGRGGMAIVFKATEKELERDVAVKVLPFSLAFDAEFVERFQREARTSAKLEHSNIIPIYRVGKKGRVIFFVMKFLRGEALSEQLSKRGKLPPNEIRKILVQTASALGYAHKNEIVHRDIKPDNIMFDESGNAIVTDFGIAKAASGTRLTGTGMSIGTPHYMSPEQARAQTLDGRSDIYSLGVVAYQCLAGVVPFDGEDSFSIGYKHIMEDITEPEMETAEHRALYDIIERMMAKSPEDRYQTAEDLVATLERGGPVLTQAREADFSEAPTTVIPYPVEARDSEPRPTSATTQTTPTTPMPRTSPSAEVEPKKKKKGALVLVGVVIFLVLGGGGAGGYWYYFMDAEWPLPFLSQSPATEPSPPPGEPEIPPDSALLAGAGPALLSDSLAPSDSTSSLDSTGGPASDSAKTVETAPPVAITNQGTLVVRTPPGGRLTIDGDSASGDSLKLDAGTHKIEIHRTGYEKFEQTVPVGRGQTIVVPVDMVQIPQPVQQQPVQARPEPTGPTRPVAPPPARTAPVDCGTDNPGIEYFNSNDCYDSAPSTTRAPVMAPPAGYDGELMAVQLAVRIGADGSVLRITRPGRQTADSRLRLAALRFAQDSLQYTPALKNRQPVEAWVRLNVRFRRR
jgi:serine/threonine protein kinase